MYRLQLPSLLLGCSLLALSPALAQTATTPSVTAAAPAAQAQPAMSDQVKQAFATGMDAVYYGLPLVVMDITRRMQTNIAHPSSIQAPVNQFGNVPAFPPADFKNVVRVNRDTLYSSAFFDLSRGPLVLSAPDTQGRYYLLPMMDAWTNVFATPGTRTTGDKAGAFLITGPGWNGAVPEGMQQIKATTNTGWILGRVQTNGPDDYAAVAKIQAGFSLVPLADYGKTYTPPVGAVDPSISLSTPPTSVIKNTSGVQFLSELAQLLKSNPPPAVDAPMIAKLATIGVVPGQDFDPSRLDPAVRKALDSIVLAVLQQMRDQQG